MRIFVPPELGGDAAAAGAEVRHKADVGIGPLECDDAREVRPVGGDGDQRSFVELWLLVEAFEAGEISVDQDVPAWLCCVVVDGYRQLAGPGVADGVEGLPLAVAQSETCHGFFLPCVRNVSLLFSLQFELNNLPQKNAFVKRFFLFFTFVKLLF